MDMGRRSWALGSSAIGTGRVLALAALLAAMGLLACSEDDSGAGGSGAAGLSGTGGGAGGSGAAGLGGQAGAGATGPGGAGGSGAAGAGGEAGAGATGGGGSGPTGAWSMGYYASWQAGAYPVSEIEWSGLTHVAMSFYMPDAAGSLSLLGGNPEVASELVTAALEHGVVPVASIGGADSGPSFQQATAAGTIDTFVAHLVGLLDEPGYEGLDIDWEPMSTADELVAVDLANRIRAARPGTLVTIPIGYINVNLGADLTNFPAIAQAYDQLNIMSYGMAGAWQGWNSWHSSPLYHQSSATPTSIDSTVQLYLEAGVPAAKLGLGIGFYGLCYSPPVTGPDQPLDGSTLVASDGTMSFTHITESYFSEEARQWDPLARVPYLSFASAHGPEGCSYVSYDDEQSIEEKGSYVGDMGLGGVIIWEINEGYLASAPAGQRNPLLSAIHDHVLQ